MYQETKTGGSMKKKSLFIRLWPVRIILWPLKYLLSPSAAIVKDAWQKLLPTKVSAEQLELFSNLTPKERWEVAQEIHGWTSDQLVEERRNSCLLAYLFLFAACGVVLGIIWSSKYLNLFQALAYLPFPASFFLLFAKRSMRVYSIDRHEVILLNDWMRLPSVWVPAYSQDQGEQ